MTISVGCGLYNKDYTNEIDLTLVLLVICDSLVISKIGCWPILKVQYVDILFLSCASRCGTCGRKHKYTVLVVIQTRSLKCDASQLTHRSVAFCLLCVQGAAKM